MKVHQNIILAGQDLGDNAERKGSNFCNEGKWNNFIEPLLPGSVGEHTLIEFGTNAGLFLKLAVLYGYNKVMGYENSKRTYDVGLKYRKESELEYGYFNEQIDEGFDFDSLPVADVILLANFHYHLYVPDWIYVLDRLRLKACHCIVVSARVKKAHWRPGAEINDLRLYFRDWQEAGAVYSGEKEDDPHPRDMWSISFKSPLLRRTEVEDIFNPKHSDGLESESTIELIHKIIGREDLGDIRELTYYRKVHKYHKEWSTEKIDKWVQDKINLFVDIRDNGLKRPILIRPDNRIMDGGHRLVMLKEMGYKTVITRIV